MVDIVAPAVFAGVSLLAGIFNFVFLIRAARNYTALIAERKHDETLHRIGAGFIGVWIFIIFADLIRFVVGAGVLLHDQNSVFLLLVSPFGSLLVAVIGLRSFR